jgi:hypothetical protein
LGLNQGSRSKCPRTDCGCGFTTARPMGAWTKGRQYLVASCLALCLADASRTQPNFPFQTIFWHAGKMLVCGVSLRSCVVALSRKFPYHVKLPRCGQDVYNTRVDFRNIVAQTLCVRMHSVASYSAGSICHLAPVAALPTCRALYL